MKRLLFGVCALVFASQSHAQTQKLPKLVETRDVPLQRTTTRPDKIPAQCKRDFLLAEACTRVWAVATQSFNKQEKGLTLLINVSQSTSLNNSFSSAGVTFAIDGEVFELPTVDWETPDLVMDESTVRFPSEALCRRIAGAKEVWVTVFARRRISVMLNPQQLAAIQAVVARYDSW